MMSARRAPAAAARTARRVTPAPRRGELHPRLQVSDIQRSRLLSAAAAAIEELGYTHTTVASIIGRARVSRRTFYELFENLEDCLLAVIEDALAQIATEIAVTEIERLPWRERLRAGLWTILCFLDREPVLARVCVVQALRGGPRVIERREQLLASLTAIVEEGRDQAARPAECPPLMAEGVVGAAVSIIHSRLLKPSEAPLGELLGELMAMIVLPYLGSAAARRERTRLTPIALPSSSEQRPAQAAQDTLSGLPMRITYRTARVLVGLAEHPGVSNRAVADHVGITDQGQMSRLLARLEGLGLLQNTGQGHTKGEANAWQLTPTGHTVTQTIRANARHSRQTA